MKRVLLFLLLLVATLPLAAQKRAFTIEDLYRVKNVGDLNVSPDGTKMTFTVTTRDLPRGKQTTAIWIANVDGSGMRQLTQGEADSNPRWSPDGRTLAFLRSGNIHLLPFAGGEAKKLTSISTGVSDPVWAPDGKAIAFPSDVYPECGADDACNRRISERWSGGKLKAHMADSLLYRHWTAWRDGMVTHTLLVNVDDGKVIDLTPGEFDFPPFSLGGPPQVAFSPDSKELAVVSNHDRERASSTNSDIFLIDLTKPGSAPRNITAANKAWDGSPKYSPDGKMIAYRLQKQPGYESDLFRLAVIDRATGQSRVLTEDYRNWIEDLDWNDDSKSIYVTGPFEGVNPVRRVDAASGRMSTVFTDRTIDAFEVARDGRSIVYIGRSVGEPSEIYRADLTTAGGTASSRRKLSSFNDALTREVDIRPAETMWVTGADGKRVHVFVVKPHGFDPSKKYPLILNVHGGPQSMWADAFRGDWQVYPGAGYVVAFPNPHGSTGYGQDYTAAISKDWGGKVYEDVMKVTDALEKLPYVDARRIGAMGWSYGGYMMMWIAGHTDRYEALAAMMGVYDLRAMYSSTEELWFPEWDLGGQPWNSEHYEKWSPSNFVRNFKTPTLVISGERDYRVPYTQSLEFFTDLQKMGVPSRLIIYSEAGHWPGWYEMALYYTAHLEWFQKYLGGGGAPWTAEAFLRNAVFDASTGRRIEEKAPEVTQGKPDVKQ